MNAEQLKPKAIKASERFLESRGYEILETSWECAAGGADIIVRDDAAVVFVEVNATHAIADALGMSTPRFKILKTCVPGRATRSEATGAEVLDRFFPTDQLRTVIHSSSKVMEGSWQWQPVVEFDPKNRAAKDYAALAEEVSDELGK